jgi:hypothetical protein
MQNQQNSPKPLVNNYERHSEACTCAECNPPAPPLLVDLAKECRVVWERTSKADPDIFGGSILDLMADNITDASLLDLKSAILYAGIYAEANDRIRRQIAYFDCDTQPQARIAELETELTEHAAVCKQCAAVLFYDGVTEWQPFCPEGAWIVAQYELL